MNQQKRKRRHFSVSERRVIEEFLTVHLAHFTKGYRTAVEMRRMSDSRFVAGTEAYFKNAMGAVRYMLEKLERSNHVKGGPTIPAGNESTAG